MFGIVNNILSLYYSTPQLGCSLLDCGMYQATAKVRNLWITAIIIGYSVETVETVETFICLRLFNYFRKFAVS